PPCSGIEEISPLLRAVQRKVRRITRTVRFSGLQRLLAGTTNRLNRDSRAGGVGRTPEGAASRLHQSESTPSPRHARNPTPTKSQSHYLRFPQPRRFCGGCEYLSVLFITRVVIPV